jgi:hypothetical protein
MPGFMPGIHVFFPDRMTITTWMAGTSPAMTVFSRSAAPLHHLRQEQY